MQDFFITRTRSRPFASWVCTQSFTLLTLPLYTHMLVLHLLRYFSL